MSDLAAWLLDRITEDERTVAAIMRMHPRWSVDQEQWVEGVGVVDDSNGSVAVVLGDYAARHIARWDPARVLAECEAKRRIVEVHKPYRRIYGLGCDVCLQPRHLPADMPGWPCATLRLLAVPYADRPGYDPSWRP